MIRRATALALALTSVTLTAHAQPRPAPMRVVTTAARPDAALDPALAAVFSRSPSLTRVPGAALVREVVADGRLVPARVAGALCTAQAEALIWWSARGESGWLVQVFGPAGAPALRFEVAAPLTEARVSEAVARATQAVAAQVLAHRARPSTPCAPTSPKTSTTSTSTPPATPHAPPERRPSARSRRRTPQRGLELPIWELRFDTAYWLLRDGEVSRDVRLHRLALEFEGVRPSAALSVPVRLAVGFGQAVEVEGRVGVRYRLASIVALHLRGVYRWTEQPYLDDQGRDREARVGVYAFLGELGATIGGGVGARGQLMAELSLRAGQLDGGGYESAAAGSAISLGYKPTPWLALRLGAEVMNASGEGALPGFSALFRGGLAVSY